MTLHLRAPNPVSAVAAPRLKLGLLTPHNPFNPRSFSGTPYYAYRALMRQKPLDIRLLCGHHPTGIKDRILKRFGRASVPAIQPGELDGLDAVVGLVASELLDGLPPDIPFFHVTDATPGFLKEAYGWDIPDASFRREARLAARAESCLYSSEIMAKRAQAELDPKRALAVPFGVNMENPPKNPPPKPPLDHLNLVFVGADWTRKGGDIALATLDRLRAEGIRAHLTLVGRIPDAARRHPHVTVAGFLDKSRPQDAARLADIYTKAHLMVLPTRGDCTPMVIAEAMAHGTPVLVTKTGGTPEMLGGKGAGEILPMSATPADWAREIMSIAGDQASYGFMSDAAFDRASTCFSWDIWAGEIARITTEQYQKLARAA